MLLDYIGFEGAPATLQLLLGLGLGLLFGIAAQISRFCLRRAVAGDEAERKPAAGVWLAALGTAILGLQAAVALGYADVSGHRWFSSDLPVLALVAGGLAFGAGMVLTRGCISRLTVLGASGNLRGLTVLVVFAIVSHAMLKGVLAPLRTSLGSFTLPAPITSLAELPGGPLLWALALALPMLGFALTTAARKRDLALGVAIGALAVAGWAATSVLLLDDFDPQPVQSLAFTLPWSETLFWTVASTAVPAGFGVGLIGGVLGGAFLSAALRGELKLQSFESPAQTLRYASGAALMGVGGVLAGGCTVGAGLSGVPTLSIAAMIALVAIVAGGKLTALALDAKPAGALPQPA